MRGFIDSGAKIEVERIVNGKSISKVIQYGDNELLNNVQDSVVKQIESEYKLSDKDISIFKLQPLIGRPLMSQIKHDLENEISLSDLKYDADKFTYFNGDQAFVMSSYDISQQKMLTALKDESGYPEKTNFCKIQEGVPGNFSEDNKKEFTIKGEKVDIYYTPPAIEGEGSNAYYKIKRNENISENPEPKNDTKKSSRRNKPK
jgi:hypothetical protein